MRMSEQGDDGSRRNFLPNRALPNRTSLNCLPILLPQVVQGHLIAGGKPCCRKI
jgi:hypothetical protein